MTLTLVGLFVASLTSTCAVPSAGAAGTEPPALMAPPGFELPADNGYGVEVSGVAAEGGLPAEVVVRVATRDGSVTYHFPGVAEDGSIKADLGPYGEISVVFRPVSGGMSAAESGCGHGLSSASGYYEGTISFHAEGLTAVDASRAKGSVGLALSLLCAEELENKPRMPTGTVLEVSGGPTAPGLTLQQRHPGIATWVQAAISENRGGVPIERSVSIATPNSSFRHRGLRSATVALPKPFSGSATFDRVGARSGWIGNLRVDFPGRAGVALAGKGLRASLRRGSG